MWMKCRSQPAFSIRLSNTLMRVRPSSGVFPRIPDRMNGESALLFVQRSPDFGEEPISGLAPPVETAYRGPVSHQSCDRTLAAEGQEDFELVEISDEPTFVRKGVPCLFSEGNPQPSSSGAFSNVPGVAAPSLRSMGAGHTAQASRWRPFLRPPSLRLFTENRLWRNSRRFLSIAPIPRA